MVQSDLQEQSSQGAFTPSGRNDILATAMGRPDRHGRVLGEPKEVGKKKYWGQSSSRERYFSQRDEIVAQVREECQADMAEQLAKVREECQADIASRVAAQVQEQMAVFLAQIEAMQKSSTVNLNFASASSKPAQVLIVHFFKSMYIICLLFFNFKPCAQFAGVHRCSHG